MQPFIKVRGLQKSFTIAGESLDILKGIDLDINEGEMLAIMGPSGVGKSTFLHILGALDKPTSGEVFYGDIDITGLKNDALANFRNKAVGFVFQFHHLLPEFTALENTMMPALIGMGSKVRGVNGLSYKEIIKNAESLLDELGIYERRDHKPGELSGGEQQRVAVARALILSPKVVLADEPTGNLDTHTGEELFDLLVKLNKKGITFIVVTHNETLAPRCRRIVRMLDGKITG